MDRLETMGRNRLLLMLRGVLMFVFSLVAYKAACPGGAAAFQIGLLTTLALVPMLFYFFRGKGDYLWSWGATLFDLAIITLLNYISIQQQGVPLYFPLYAFLAFEGACWWGQTGALVSGALAATLEVTLWSVAPKGGGTLVIAGGVVFLTLGWAALFALLVPRLLRWMDEPRRRKTGLSGRPFVDIADTPGGFWARIQQLRQEAAASDP